MGDKALNDLGVIAGIGFGIFIVTVIVSSAGALLGFLLGSLVNR